MGEGIEAKQISTFLLRLFRQDFKLSGAFMNKTKTRISPSLLLHPAALRHKMF